MKPIITMLLIAISSTTQAEPSADDFTVSINGLDHDGGKVTVNLFREQDDLFQPAFLSVSSAIENQQARVVFKDLPYGEYALFAYHDENNNNDLDHNLFNFPNEPMGFSGTYRLSLFSGKPDFERLRFVFNAEQREQMINMEQ